MGTKLFPRFPRASLRQDGIFKQRIHTQVAKGHNPRGSWAHSWLTYQIPAQSRTALAEGGGRSLLQPLPCSHTAVPPLPRVCVTPTSPANTCILVSDTVLGKPGVVRGWHSGSPPWFLSIKLLQGPLIQWQDRLEDKFITMTTTATIICVRYRSLQTPRPTRPICILHSFLFLQHHCTRKERRPREVKQLAQGRTVGKVAAPL